MIKSRVRPYFLQPYKLLPYLSTKKQDWPVEFTREYFLSFEDALWNLLPRLGYKLKSKFLVPTFYCVDVINNIKAHGYEVAFYPINKDLTVDEEQVARAILSESPDIFIDFEAAGVPTGISTKILRKLSFNTLIIQDKVHSVVGSTIDNFPISKRHLVLTSSRKISAFPGSMAIYSRNARRNQTKLPLPYVFKALFLWAKYLLTLKVSTLFSSVMIATHAERILKKHDDLIGDEKTSAPLSKYFMEVTDRFDIEKIESCKEVQFSIYNRIVDFTKYRKSDVWTIPGAQNVARKLRGFPVILRKDTARVFRKLCRKQGFLTVAQLDDSLWSKKQNLFLLPLGPHLTNKEVNNIAKIAQEALTQALQYDTITA